MQFFKYHASGNDYIVLAGNSVTGENELSRSQIQRICHRHYGIGSDGILLGPLVMPKTQMGLRIMNPDGSEAEKSGNGLRIFARYVWDRGMVGEEPFPIVTPGGTVQAQVHPGGQFVTVEMGTVSFHSGQIPVSGPPREVLNETMCVGGQELTFCAATIGNPHCVIQLDEISPEIAQKWGPLIETDARFPNRTNVQFLNILDRSTLQIEIWERGAGYTLASGSSSCAAAAVAHKLGLCDEQVAVNMPGGTLDITLSKDFAVTMTGPVTKICDGTLSFECNIGFASDVSF